MDVAAAIQNRRAYRSLAPTDITDDLVADLASSAQLAPSCFNNQPTRLVFVRDPKRLQAFHEAYAAGNEWCRNASLVIAVFSKPDLDCIIKDRIYYRFDVGLATAFLILRATELGLVAHPIAGFNPAAVRSVLGIPDEYDVITLVLVGRHAEVAPDVLSPKQLRDENERPPRLPRERVAFYDYVPAGALG